MSGVGKPFPQQVTEIHQRLVEIESYRRFLVAEKDEDAVEGSTTCDDVMAAEMLRAGGRKLGYPDVGKAKLAVITGVLDDVLGWGPDHPRRLNRAKANAEAARERLLRATPGGSG